MTVLIISELRIKVKHNVRHKDFYGAEEVEMQETQYRSG